MLLWATSRRRLKCSCLPCSVAVRARASRSGSHASAGAEGAAKLALPGPLKRRPLGTPGVQQRFTTEKAPLIRRFAGMARRLLQRVGWGRVFGLAVLASFLALGAWDAMPLQLAHLKTFDLYQLAKPRVPIAHPVVIVDIDEASLNSLGQ